MCEKHHSSCSTLIFVPPIKSLRTLMFKNPIVNCHFALIYPFQLTCILQKILQPEEKRLVFCQFAPVFSQIHAYLFFQCMLSFPPKLLMFCKIVRYLFFCNHPLFLKKYRFFDRTYYLYSPNSLKILLE